MSCAAATQELSARQRRGTAPQQGAGAVRALGVAEALLRIQTRQFLREMNMSLDFSFLDTPRSGAPIRCCMPVSPDQARP